MARIGDALRGDAWRWLLLVALLSLSTLSRADEAEPFQIPKPGQPTEDFYNAAGIGVKLIATAVPTEIARGEWMTYTLTIVNLVNARDVAKPSLKALPAFDVFQVDEAAELDAKDDPTRRDRRVFTYRLRPYSEETKLIPEVKFRYFHPQIKAPPSRPGLRFPSAYSNPVAIVVKPPIEPPPAAPTVLEIPEFTTQIATGAEVLRKPAGNPPVWVWIALLILAPVLAAGWVLIWRRLYPDAARLVLLKRNRAVRHALAAIVKAQSLPPDRMADGIATAVLGYLRERYELPPGVFTPREAAAHLRAAGCSNERVEQVESLLRDCDNRRFAPALFESEMAVDAAQLIVMLEEPA